jgi:hypothetical protein|tara:strand:- start:356 stop:658 length:303 start_codon:yes stop_codon:yes gene_type:complete
MNKIEELLKHVEENCDELCDAAENNNNEEDVGVFSEEIVSEILNEMVEDGVIKKQKIDTFNITTDDDTLNHIIDEMVDSHLILKVNINGEDRYILRSQDI